MNKTPGSTAPQKIRTLKIEVDLSTHAHCDNKKPYVKKTVNYQIN